MQKAPPTAFVIFGITGDLAARKLLPALLQLQAQGGLHRDTVIVGYGRSDLDDAALKDRLRAALGPEAGSELEAARAALEARIHYVQGGYDDEDSFRELARRLDELGQANRVFYTATPPETYQSIVTRLACAGLNQERGGWSRLVIEKPFGNDLETARALNAHVLEHFREDQVYRIDHYLAKETAQNLAVLRFANSIFEPVWSNRYVDHVQITMVEPMGVEGRGSFYESAGVLRDVFQNHLLQLVALVAMEPPARYDAGSVRDEKVKVFNALACARPERAVLGQYVSGNGMNGYREEEGVDPRSRQATFAAVELELRNWRWSGVPFYVRSGKRLEMKATEIVLHFKTPPHVPFDLPSSLKADRLVLRLVPDEGIVLRFNGKRPGQGIELDRISLDFLYGRSFDRPNPDAYETLLLDVMLGDATLFMRADEVEAQWRVIGPLLELVDRDPPTPSFYEAGSMGPDPAYRLLEDEGRYWHRPAED
ncbi:MAG TPA: glucose-6-phosphate dehydrogenase [Trueperaceae bacterium]|nr:glucose-6-phosphate dehydrogenase [Trueperaceae bacterium]